MPSDVAVYRIRLPLYAAIAVALCGCPDSVIEDYEAERTRSLGPPGTMSRTCAPDARLALSRGMVQSWLNQGITRAPRLAPTVEFKGPLGVRGTVMPSLQVTQAQVIEGPPCPACLTLQTTLEGPVSWTLGPATGSDRMKLTADVQLDLSTQEDRGDWSIFVQPSALRNVEIQSAMLGSVAEGVVTQRIEQAAQKRLAETSQPVQVGSLPASDLPTRDVRLRSAQRGLVAEFCLNIAERGQLPPTATLPPVGWELEIARDSLVGLARRAAFEAGPQDYDVVAIPSDFTVAGTGFTMDFRLWRLTGRGWWRDYRVTGDASVTNQTLSLAASSVEQRAESPGASAADPLAELGEGWIVQTIEESLTFAVPTVHNLETPYGKTYLAARAVEGRGDSVVLSGVLRAPGKPSERKVPARRGSTR